jgi:serine protease Do
VFAVILIGLLPKAAHAQKQKDIAILERLGETFASIAEDASPAVVGIKAKMPAPEQPFSMDQSPFGRPFDPFGEDFFDFFFRRRSPQGQRQQNRRGQTAQGSGFIISDKGYVLTNSHVVSDAEEISVELQDGRSFTAEVVGTDPESDVGVIKIDGENLPVLEMADSDEIEVGKWVLAIGNPLGLSHTVTAGIISAKGRSGLQLAAYEDFIQTDAAINFGNSGGPLINLRGKAVGINTAIAGPGGNIGIGFAIPSNMAKRISDQLIEDGEVVRGYLGVLPQDMTVQMAKALDLEGTKGVLIPQVTEGSAADKAGIEQGDVIVEVEGRPIESASGLRNRIAEYKPGTRVDITVLRDGNRKTLTATLEKRPAPEELAGRQPQRRDTLTTKLGFSVRNLTESLAQRYGFEGESGVIVDRVARGSMAAQKGITPGMLIKEVNQEKVENVRQFRSAMNKAADKGQALLLVDTGQASQYVLLEIDND